MAKALSAGRLTRLMLGLALGGSTVCAAGKPPVLMGLDAGFGHRTSTLALGFRILVETTSGFVRVLALTATVSDEDRGDCQEAGMDDFLVKPLDTNQLRATPARWLS